MSDFGEALNDILVKAYRNIIKLEQLSLQQISGTGLSINEMHLMEIVRKYGDVGAPVGVIAQKLSITNPSATVAVNKLEKKGYVKRQSNVGDGRMVNVVLTEQGIKIDNLHKQYHKDMVEAIAAEMTEEEKKHLISGIHKLGDFFVRSIEQVTPPRK